jgi:cell shape-determining protein MreD
MNALFFVITTLFFIVLQTLVSPCFAWFVHGFDLTIILVLFLSLHFSHYAVLAAIIFIGGIMDSLSGGPFFLYVFSYVWIYVMVQLVKQFVFQTSGLFVPVIGMVSVMIQQGLGVFAIFIQQGQTAVFQMDFAQMVRHAVYGAVLVPFGVWLLAIIYQNWNYMVRMLQKKWEKRVNS